jgi:hypothetical protein
MSVRWKTYHAAYARSTITGRSAILVFNTTNKRGETCGRERDARAHIQTHISVQYREPTAWMFNISNILDNAQFGSV